MAKSGLRTKAAYYIAPNLTELEVTTAGGGGDNVKYYPYQAIEVGFQQMLKTVFGSVEKLTTAPSPAELAAKDISYLVVPTIVTTSGSTGFFTWPPTNFSVDLACQVRGQEGSVLATPRVVGVGAADTGERLSDHGIAGRRAMADALVKMQSALREVNLSVVPSSRPSVGSDSIADRLGKLNGLLDRHLITQGEYDKKRKAILEKL